MMREIVQFYSIDADQTIYFIGCVKCVTIYYMYYYQFLLCISILSWIFIYVLSIYDYAQVMSSHGGLVFATDITSLTLKNSYVHVGVVYATSGVDYASSAIVELDLSSMPCCRASDGLKSTRSITLGLTFRSNSENLLTVIKELAIAWILCGRLHA